MTKKKVITEAEALLEMVESIISDASGDVSMTPEQESFADSVLGEGEKFIPLNIIIEEVVGALGELAREPLKALLWYKVVPAPKEAFLEFFKDRSDIVSRACYKKLVEDDKEQTSYQPF